MGHDRPPRSREAKSSAVLKVYWLSVNPASVLCRDPILALGADAGADSGARAAGGCPVAADPASVDSDRAYERNGLLSQGWLAKILASAREIGRRRGSCIPRG